MRTCRSAVAIPNVSPFVATFSDIIRRHAVMRRIGPVQPTSPEALLLSEFITVERVIAFVTGRRRLRPADAEEFASHVASAVRIDQKRLYAGSTICSATFA